MIDFNQAVSIIRRNGGFITHGNTWGLSLRVLYYLYKSYTIFVLLKTCYYVFCYLFSL